MVGVDVHGVADLKVMVLDLKMKALVLDLINYNEPRPEQIILYSPSY